MTGSSGGAGPQNTFPIVLAVFAAVLYLALVVCAFGFISLLTDTEVITRADAGPLIGPSMVAAAVVIVFVALTRAATRYDAGVRAAAEARTSYPVRISPGGSVVVGVASSLGYVVIGSMLYAVTTGELFQFVLFAGITVTRLYTLAVGVLAAIVYLLFAFVLSHQGEHPARPLWPWER